MRSLRRFWEAGHADAEQPLRAWYAKASKAHWASMSDVLQAFPETDLVGGDKLVFNIGGNKYRLICGIKFGESGLYVLWIGTHAEYDKLDVSKL